MDTKYNEQPYEVTINIQNSTGTYNINPNAIVNLTIEETLADWVTRGTLAIYQSFDTIENKTEAAKEIPTFSFKNDGTDLIVVQVYPKFDENISYDKKHWTLSYKFAIYDVEDVELPPGAQNMASAATKCKKFYFWDNWYQIMLTDVMEYSTALSEEVQIAPGTSPTDEERSLPTGTILKEILEKCLKKNSQAVSYEPVGGGEEWDTGESKMFYTAPAYATAFDSLMYVYNRHISSKKDGDSNDFCILTKERGPDVYDEGYLTLRPMSDYFDKAGKTEPKEFQIENFKVQGYAPNDKPAPLEGDAGTSRRAPVASPSTMQLDTKLGHYSIISSYRFVDISPIVDTQRFITTPVNSFDFKNRTYNVEFNTNKVDAAKEFIKNKYIKPLPVADGITDDSFLITVNERKTTQRNIMPTYSLYGNDYDITNRQADGLQKILKTGVFQNTCIHFRTLGSTNRTTGRFIVTDQDYIEDTNFNNKFFGQWFIINVRHVFEAGIYFNEIAAVKVHRFKAPV